MNSGRLFTKHRFSVQLCYNYIKVGIDNYLFIKNLDWYTVNQIMLFIRWVVIDVYFGLEWDWKETRHETLCLLLWNTTEQSSVMYINNIFMKVKKQYWYMIKE